MFVLFNDWCQRICIRCNNLTYVKFIDNWFGTMLTKNSLKGFSKCSFDVDFSIREIVLHVLTLPLNTGFTVFQNFFVSVTLCKYKFL